MSAVAPDSEADAVNSAVRDLLIAIAQHGRATPADIVAGAIAGVCTFAWFAKRDGKTAADLAETHKLCALSILRQLEDPSFTGELQ